jgi:hypothetical protein
MRYALSAAVLSLLLLTILSLGCNDSSDNEISGTTFDAVGLGHPGTAPGGPPGPGEALNVDGVWRASTTVTSNGCGSRVPSLAGEQVVDLSQSDSILNVTVFSACGAPIATGVGSINGSTVSLSFTQNLPVSPNCTLRIQTVQSGSVQSGDQSLISGTSRISVSGTGNCGNGLPCQVQANLLMERCPPASCTFHGCP